MAVPVLKNRILAIEPGFNEAKFGVRNFAEFVEKFGKGLVELSTGQGPNLQAVWIGEQPAAEERNLRVRPDLWNAVLDYSAGHFYVWEDGKVVALSSRPPAAALQLPTLSREELISWRSDFLDHQTHSGRLASGPGAELKLKARLNLATKALPEPLRGPWLVYLANQVVRRLNSWFVDSGLRPPDDLVTRQSSEHASAADDLRSTLVQLVQELSEEELRLILLPASVIARVRERRRDAKSRTVDPEADSTNRRESDNS